MSYPNQIKQRRKIDALTGIKSSLDQLRSVIALIYLLYVSNDRKSFVKYSIPNGDKIVIEPILLGQIKELLGYHDIEQLINGNPLIINQYEPLYVGVTLLLKLGYLKMEGKKATAERTGGVRYPKQLYFANNTMLLDLILLGFEEGVRYEALYEWLQNKKSTNTAFEDRVCSFITTCTVFTQFKLRDNNSNELFFQTEGIYEKLIQGNEDVLYSDSQEFVGPTRIYNNILKEGLEPWIKITRGILSFSEKDSPNAETVGGIISTTLDIYNVKDDTLSIMENNDEKMMEDNKESEEPYQLIYYGSPGTGKSFEIDKKIKDEKLSAVRTTFHPDSDYSTFVGAYKPIVEEEEVRVIPVVVENGISLNQNEGTYTEKRITYRFVVQAFMKAYLAAWKKMVENPDNPKAQILVIEEINRGNCAQIFGDLFQLLDRADNGFSSYPIEADTDLQQAINDAFKESEYYRLSDNINVEGVVKDYVSNYAATLSEDIQEGRILLLPPNLFIWATMNTSDQSLFPIDSAFKRRWEWKYIPIKEHKDKKYTIEIDDKKYDWWGFLERINKVIGDTTSSEDKKLGYFFVKAESAVVSDEQFVGKVLFYIWNDVFKNYGFDHPIFSKGDRDRFEFSDFFNEEGRSDKENVQLFLKRLEESIKMGSPLDITTKKDAPTPDEETTATKT